MRKRSKHRKIPVLKNPLGYVLESITPIHTNPDLLLTIRLKNSEALYSLVKGNALKNDVNVIISMFNATFILCNMGIGNEHRYICDNSRSIVMGIRDQFMKFVKISLTNENMECLNAVMELHDAQLNIATYKDLENIPLIFKKKHQNPECNLVIPFILD